MHKKESAAHLRIVISDIITIALEHMHILATELKKLTITDSSSEQEKHKAEILSNMLTLMNDIIHPAHNIAVTIFPDAKDFIEYCKRNQKLAIEKKMIAPGCKCYECQVDKVGA